MSGESDKHYFLVVDKPTQEQERDLYPLVIYPVDDKHSIVEAEEYNIKRVKQLVKARKETYGEAFHEAMSLSNPVEVPVNA